MDRKIVSKRPVSYHEAKAELETRVSEGELNELQAKTWEYLKLFGTMDPVKAREFYEEVYKVLVEGLEPSEDLKELAAMLAANIVSICPKSRGEVRSFTGYDYSKVLSDIEKFEKLYGVVEKYCKS